MKESAKEPLSFPCPDAETMAAFAEGSLSDVESNVVREHLISCVVCHAKNERLMRLLLISAYPRVGLTRS